MTFEDLASETSDPKLLLLSHLGFEGGSRDGVLCSLDRGRSSRICVRVGFGVKGRERSTSLRPHQKDERHSVFGRTSL